MTPGEHQHGPAGRVDRETAETMYAATRQQIAAGTDRLYAVLLAVEWVAAMALAGWGRPAVEAVRAGWGWSGGPTAAGRVAVAVMTGGLLAAGPAVLAVVRPGRLFTRHAVTAGLVGLAALVCRQNGGRWETVGGTFVVLALLARYRDWSVLMTGLAVMAVDRATRGLGGASVPAEVRSAVWQQLAWAAAESGFLAAGAYQSTVLMWQGVRRTADLARGDAVLQALKATSPDGLLVTDESGGVVTYNARFADLYRLPPEATAGFTPDTLLAATGRAFADPDTERARIARLRADPVTAATHAVPLADGRTLERTTRPIVGPDGRPLGRVWYLRDITDRVSAEAQAALNRKLALVASRTDNAVVITDPLGHVEWVNDAFTRITGYTLAEVAGRKPGSMLQGPETDPATIDRVRAAVRAGQGVRTEIKNYAKNGRGYWLSMDIQPVRDPAGGVAHFVAIESDVTERRRAEMLVRRSELLLRSLVDSIPDPIFFKDPDAVYMGCNRAFAELVGQPVDHVVGTTDADLFPPEVAAGRRAAVSQLLATGRPVQFEEVLTYPDGRRVDVDTLRTPLVGPAGERMGVLGVSRNITARKAAERALTVAHADAQAAQGRAEAASRAKSEFLANMSHEIRTPLNGVVGMVELLEATPLDEGQRRYATILRASADALLSLINDILDFSKIEAGKLELEQADFDLHAAVEEAVAVMAPKAAKKGLQLASRFDPAVPRHARGDAARLRQVIYNLVNNGVKFTDAGAVTVTVVPDGGSADPLRLRVEVTDTGCGIPPDRLDRLFKSFSQVDASTTRKYGGTGLGLAICKQLVELMGGTVGVRSEVGRGSTFWADVGLAPVPGEPPAPTIPADLWQLPVLIVDGNPTHAAVLRDMLAGWHLRPTVAASATVTTDGDGRPFRLVLCDVDTVGGTAAAVAAAVRPVAAVPVLGLRSVGSGLAAGDLAAAGLAAVVDKPVRQSTLFDTIQTTLAAGPAVPMPAAAPVVPPAAVPTFAGGGTRHLLVVDDNEINQIVAAELLRKGGWTCDLAADGRAAVAAVMAPPPGGYAAVLMDCQMPEMDGFEATRHIRRSGASTADGRRLPVIALTANAVKGDREACLAVGMDAYLSKPLNPPELYAVLDRWAVVARPPARAA